MIAGKHTKAVKIVQLAAVIQIDAEGKIIRQTASVNGRESSVALSGTDGRYMFTESPTGFTVSVLKR